MRRLLLDRRFVLWLYVGLVVVATVHKVATGKHNNYLIFVSSFPHLLDGQDLYRHFPEDHFDLFKYSPTFAVFMAPLFAIGTWAGAVVWNLLNVIPLLLGLARLVPDERKLVVAWWLLLLDQLTNLQNFQSNGLAAGLVVWTFVALERGRTSAGALCTVAGGFLKVYGLAAGALALLYPRRARFALACILWTLVLAAVPLAVVPADSLAGLYASWLRLLAGDHAVMEGVSAMGILKSWFGLRMPNWPVQLAGTLLMAVPLLHRRARGHPAFRLRYLAALLLWLVIFNHKSESPTFVIATAGAMLWMSDHRLGRIDFALLGLLFVLTSLSSTDVFPDSVRIEWVRPKSLKALPCVLIWIAAMAPLVRGRAPGAALRSG